MSIDPDRRLRPNRIVVFKFSLANKLFFEVRSKRKKNRGSSPKRANVFLPSRGARKRVSRSDGDELRYLDTSIVTRRFFVHFYQYVRYLFDN